MLASPLSIKGKHQSHFVFMVQMLYSLIAINTDTGIFAKNKINYRYRQSTLTIKSQWMLLTVHGGSKIS